MNMESKKGALYLALSYSIVPVLIALSMATAGAILPHLSRVPVEWNIQYIPFVVAAMVGLLIGLKVYESSDLKKLSIGASIVNVFWLVYFGYAVVTLWGEKF